MRPFDPKPEGVRSVLGGFLAVAKGYGSATLVVGPFVFTATRGLVAIALRWPAWGYDLRYLVSFAIAWAKG